jgi:hypothetical protein
MDSTRSEHQEPLNDHQRGCLTAIDTLLDANTRGHSTPLVATPEMLTALIHIAGKVCGSPERAEKLIRTAIDDNEPASNVLRRLQREWADEDARLTISLNNLRYGGTLQLAEQPDGMYSLTAIHEAADDATVTLRLTATEMDEFTARYVTHRDTRR